MDTEIMNERNEINLDRDYLTEEDYDEMNESSNFDDELEDSGKIEDGVGEDIEAAQDEVGMAEEISEDEEEINEDETEDEAKFEIIDNNSSFIDREAGNIVVMDKDEGESFDLKYIDISNIAIVRRIRLNKNVDDLVKSIRSTGLLEPVVVAPTATEGIYVLLNGFRRLLACARVGKRNIPCIINTRVRTPDIPILESIYNHSKPYNMREIVGYINYLEKEKGIISPSMIEFLLQLDTGDYTKLKDILNDNDEDIVSRLMSGQLTIGQAFKKLEQRRKSETKEQKDLRKAEQVYEGEEAEAKELEGSGEQAEGTELTEEEIRNLAISASELDEDLDNTSLEELVEEGKKIVGYEDKKQDPDNRERVDPVVRKAVFARDKYTCQCCKRGGPSYVDVLDYHHIIPVFLNKGINASLAGDNMDNGITVCILCHRMIHLYSTGELQIPKSKTQEELDKMTEEERIIYLDDQNKFKRIVKLGAVIRKLIEKKGMKLAEYKKKHPVGNIGRKAPSYRTGISPVEVERAMKKR